MGDFEARLHHVRTGPSLRERAVDRTYWSNIFAPVRAYNAVTTSASNTLAFNTAATQSAIDDGFFCTPPLCSAVDVERVLLAIECVEQAQWPAVFAFMDDAVWDLLAADAVVSLVKSVIGDDAVQLPGLWAKRVRRGDDAGWSPHVDKSGAPKLRADGRPARLSVWIPLTDATVDNGCMHVVPERVFPTLSHHFDTKESLAVDDVIRLLHHVRALPAAAGAVLGWRETTLHWGGQSVSTADDDGRSDRVSIALEYGHPDVAFSAAEQPVFPVGLRPDFPSRLALVGRSLVMYGAAQDREPFAHHFVALGRALSEVVRER